MRDVAADRDLRRTLVEERAEDRRLGRVPGGGVVDGDGLHRGTEDVGEQDELLPPLVGHLADRGEELDAAHPLRLAGPDLPQEAVEVSHQGQHDLPASSGPGVPSKAARTFATSSSSRALCTSLISASLIDGWAPSQAAFSSCVSSPAVTVTGLLSGTSGRIASTAPGIASRSNPRSRSDRGASRRSHSASSPATADALARASATRRSASGAPGTLRATTCGSTTACVSACGRSWRPPRTWQILWCRPDPARAKERRTGRRRAGRRSRPVGPRGVVDHLREALGQQLDALAGQGGGRGVGPRGPEAVDGVREGIEPGHHAQPQRHRAA